LNGEVPIALGIVAPDQPEARTVIAAFEADERFRIVGLAAEAGEVWDWSFCDVVVVLGGTGVGAPRTLLVGGSMEGAGLLGVSLPLEEEGVRGRLPTTAGPEQIKAAVLAIAVGLVVGLPQGRAAGDNPPKDDDPPVALTAREGEVMQLAARGFSNAEIARALGITDHTVKYHLSMLYRKLEAANRTEAVARALSLGLVSI
jgi:DNA-binding CsgD family transcriptional regulator